MGGTGGIWAAWGRGQSPSRAGFLCVQVAEIISPTADGTAVELVRLRSLEAKGVTVRTLSAQGESVDSAVAAIPLLAGD